MSHQTERLKTIRAALEGCPPGMAWDEAVEDVRFLMAELEAVKTREEAAARHWMGEATTEDNILLNNLAGEYRDRTLAASEPPGETGPTY